MGEDLLSQTVAQPVLGSIVQELSPGGFSLADHWADWQWLTRALVDDGLRVTLTDQHGPWLLYRVMRPRDR